MPHKQNAHILVETQSLLHYFFKNESQICIVIIFFIFEIECFFHNDVNIGNFVAFSTCF